MVGKFILVAFLFVSLTQVQGNELEEAIKNGLSKVKSMYENGQNKVDSSIEAVGYKRKAVERKTNEMVMKSVMVQLGITQAIRNSAKAMEEKAKEQNKPGSVFECIRKTERNANNQIQTLTEKFKSNMTNLEKSSLTKIQTESKPLYGMLDALSGEYEKVVKTIQACKTTSCVDNAVAGCAKWLEQMNVEIGKIFNRVGNEVSNHGKEASLYLNSHLRRLNQIKSDAIRDIKKCVFD